MTERDKKLDKLILETWRKLNRLRISYQKPGGRIGEGCYSDRYYDSQDAILKEYRAKRKQILNEP